MIQIPVRKQKTIRDDKSISTRLGKFQCGGYGNLKDALLIKHFSFSFRCQFSAMQRGMVKFLYCIWPICLDSDPIHQRFLSETPPGQHGVASRKPWSYCPGNEEQNLWVANKDVCKLTKRVLYFWPPFEFWPCCSRSESNGKHSKVNKVSKGRARSSSWSLHKPLMMDTARHERRLQTEQGKLSASEHIQASLDNPRYHHLNSGQSVAPPLPRSDEHSPGWQWWLTVLMWWLCTSPIWYIH